MNVLPEPQQPFIKREEPAPMSPVLTGICLAATLLLLALRVLALFAR